MGHSGSYINAKPVRQIADIQAVLGESVSGLGQLCTSANLNMWAKYKPVRYNTQDEITDAQRQSVNYGLVLNAKTSASAIMTFAASLGSGGLAWAYNKPRGRSNNEYFRRLDFYRYQHAAVCPMVPAPSATAVFAVDPHPTLIDNVGIQPVNGNIQLADLNLSSSDLMIAYRAKPSGTLITTAIQPGDEIPFGSGGYTYQYATYFKLSSTNLVPTPYPYFELAVDARYGISFQGVCDRASHIFARFHCIVYNLGRERQLNVVSFHARKNGNFSLNADGYTYTITQYASGVLSDNEQDLTVGVSATYAASETHVNMGNTAVQRTYDFALDPYEVGRFFVRAQYIINGRTYKDVYLNFTINLPAEPEE